MKVSGIFKALGGLALLGGGLLLGDKGKDIFVKGSHEAKEKDETNEDSDYEIVIDDETTEDSQEEE